jgi:hypothetical protein
MLSELLNERTGRLYTGLVEGRAIAGSARTASDTRKYAGCFAFQAETRGAATPEGKSAASEGGERRFEERGRERRARSRT